MSRPHIRHWRNERNDVSYKDCDCVIGEDHDVTETTSTNDWLDELLWNEYGDAHVNSKAKQAILSHITQAEKAYGGCHNCYGKGYATVNDRWVGHDTDTDIGSPGGVITGGNPTAMKFCTCDRGKQLEALIAQERVEAQAEILRGFRRRDFVSEDFYETAVIKRLANTNRKDG